jgi:threonine aldolase
MTATGLIDLRSDTVTRPTPGMRRAMAEAEVGDDVYGEDPTVAELQERVAGLFGFEAALFTPTGSMANVLAVAALVGPGQEVLCEARAHILRAELGAHGALTGLTSRTWVDERGQVDLGTIRSMYAPDMGPFFVRTTAVSVENTHNFAGGTVLPLADLEALRGWADEVGVGIHVDGARIWNAHVATGTSLADYGAVADTLAVCLSKGLGAPIGSPRPGCTPWTTTSSGWPRTTSTPGCSRRRAAPTPPSPRPTSSWSTYPTLRRWWPRPASTACSWVRSARPRSACSRTST